MRRVQLSVLLLISIFVFDGMERLRAASIVVNEYRNGGGMPSGSTKFSRNSYIEFVITQDMTAAELAALTFGDTNGMTSALNGVFRFDLGALNTALSNAGRSDFLAGTIFVVKGTDLGSQNLSYDPTLVNLTNNDAWSIELVAGSGALDHSETLLNGNIRIQNNGEVIWVSSDNPPSSSTDTSGFIDAIGHDTSPGAIANDVIADFGANHIYNANVNSGRSLYNSAGAVVALATSGTGTMAAGNNSTNTAWIQNDLRLVALGVPEPGRAVLLLVAAVGMAARRRRA